MIIDAHTKLSTILKENKNALDAIVGISSRFEKLRNPLLRKVMAPRTTLSMAAKVGGCTVNEFFQKLEPLGFTIDKNKVVESDSKKELPGFFKGLTGDRIHELDVRPVIASGRDPLNLIMEKLKMVKEGEALKIVNTFEPVPLINMLRKKGYETWVDDQGDEHIETWFFRANAGNIDVSVSTHGDDWDAVFAKFKERMVTIDVRHLEMPAPMITILETLEKLPDNQALLVHHKKIPLFLLPELASKNYEFRIKEIAEGQVEVLIFKD